MARYQVGIQTEARIVDATRELLAENGLEGTTLKAICDRAGVQAGSFYNLFSSKEEAVLRVVREAINAVDPDPEGVGKDSLADLIDAYIAFVTEQPSLANIYVQVAIAAGSADTPVGARYLRHHQRRVERFSDAMKREGLAESPEGATAEAEVLLGALDGLTFRWSLDNRFDFRGHVKMATERFV